MSLCAMSGEELRVKEKRGRASLADSSSSLSILSAGLSLLLGLFRRLFQHSAGQHRREAKPQTSVTPVSLAEGRQEQICPTQLWVVFQVFLD